LRFRCGLAVVTVALALLLAARQPVQRDQAPFRTGVEHVSIPVVVTDRDDRPVPGLTKADFEITMHGRPQAIATFEAIWVPEANRDLHVAAPEADVSVNTQPAATARQFAVIVDDLHIIESHAVPVKRLLTDFVRAVASDDEVAIVFAGRSDLSLNFTTSLDRMLEAIDRVPDALGFGLDASPDRKGAAFQARSTLFTLQNAVATLANSRFVRRAIVYVSGGAPGVRRERDTEQARGS
jgi:VWFA-related protein